MSKKYEIDNLDREIISILQKDSRIPFEEIARLVFVSGGTIHIRVNKLKEMGIIKGSRIVVDHERLGFDVTAFIGVNLHKASDYKIVIKKLSQIKQILEIHYTTGNYSLFIKVLTKSTTGLRDFLVENLQRIKEIQSTETFISLENPIQRDVNLINLKQN